MASRSSTELTVGVALIQLLERYQVEHVFGIPGVHTIELYRGLAASGIQHHTPRHEQGAGFMADGYARVSQKPGVCFVITGPGFTNIATPMGQALADSIPMLVISSVNDTLNTSQARGMLHEMPNQLAFSREVTRFSQTVHAAEELPDALARAFNLFNSARPGPVHLQLPVSLLGQSADQSLVDRVQQSTRAGAAHYVDTQHAASLLDNARQPFILAGGGARNASKAVSQLAEKLDAPVHLTINARGCLSHEHPLAVPATCSLQTTRDAVNQADIVLAVGTELAATDYDQYKDHGFKVNPPLIRCDIDPLQLNNNLLADCGLCGDAASTLSALTDQVTAKTDSRGQQRAALAMQAAYSELSGEMHRHLALLEAIRDQVPNTIFVGDSTQLIYSGNMIFNTARPQQWFNSSTGFGTLGYALPAATGAALAANGDPVVCLIGDGGIQFVLGELGALKDTGLSVAIIVWCNHGYREIKTTMENAQVSTVGVEFAVPDFIAVANAYGITAKRMNDDRQISKEILRAHRAREPVLIEIDEAEFMASSLDH